MPVHIDFVRAWRNWLCIETPIKNSKQHRFAAPAYQVEVVLDHLDSHLYTLGLALLEGKNWDFEKHASEELVELDRLTRELDSLELTPTERKCFDESIAADRALLIEIKQNRSQNDGEAQ